jgi:hypothetical protein
LGLSTSEAVRHCEVECGCETVYGSLFVSVDDWVSRERFAFVEIDGDVDDGGGVVPAGTAVNRCWMTSSEYGPWLSKRSTTGERFNTNGEQPTDAPPDRISIQRTRVAWTLYLTRFEVVR